MRREIEAIFIDVDGCLLPTDGDVSPVYFLGLNQISQHVKEANQGSFPKIGFCTGRDRNYVEAVSFLPAFLILGRLLKAELLFLIQLPKN